MSIKREKQAKIDALLNECKVFWAFSDTQFQGNKTPLQEGEKYVSIGAGGYLPKSESEKLKQGFTDIEKWYKEAIKDSKARKKLIAYELSNYEAFYTGDIDDALNGLGANFTREEVMEVYDSERGKH